MTSLIVVDAPEVLDDQVVPSPDVRMVPLSPTETYDGIASLINPVPVSYWLLKVFAPRSLTPVVTLILYVVEYDKLEDGITVNVFSELDSVGEEDICTQVLKLSEDT